MFYDAYRYIILRRQKNKKNERTRKEIRLDDWKIQCLFSCSHQIGLQRKSGKYYWPICRIIIWLECYDR